MRRVRVGIVGAGMAGLTAALRLAERGFTVTVYERNWYLGGLFGAHDHGDGVYHEHCYHMLLNWYHNFWDVAEDIGLDREQDFEPRPATRYLFKGGARPSILTNPGSPAHALDNLFSGIAPPPDMFLWSYSALDLLTQRFPRRGILDEYSVNSFMQSRPYMSERAARLHDNTLAKAFAVPSYLTSATSYQAFVKYGFRRPEPSMWILRGDTQQHFFRYFQTRLAQLGCVIERDCHVRSAARHDAPDDAGQYRVASIGWRYLTPAALAPEAPQDRDRQTDCWRADRAEPARFPRPPGRERAGDRTEADVDYLILAIPPNRVADILFPHSLAAAPALEERRRLIRLRRMFPASEAELQEEEAGAALAPILKLKSEPLASLDVYFGRRLPDVPREHTVLMGSRYGLTFIDNSQAWPGLPHTALNLVASDFRALALLRPRNAIGEMLAELSEYIPFDPREGGDVDWSRLHLQTNIGDELFINEVGSAQYRPGPRTEIPNVFLAGDYCNTVIDAVTLEGAVVSGLEAAQAVQAQAILDGRVVSGDPGAWPIRIAQPESYPDGQLSLLKLMLAPYAYAAKSWSWMQERLEPGGGALPQADLSSALSRLAGMPYAAMAAWVETASRAWLDAFGLGRRVR